MSYRTRRWAVAAAGMAVALVTSQAAAQAASTTPTSSTVTPAGSGILRTLQSRGSSSAFPAAHAVADLGALNLDERGLTRYGPISHSPRPSVVTVGGQQQLAAQSGAAAPLAAPAYPPVAAPTAAHSTSPGVKNTWQGLDEADNERAAGFSLEPPDQGMCVGNGKVLEVINDVARVYTTAGAPLTPAVSLASLFGYPEAFDPATDRYGPFLTDPSCVFDPVTQRFYVVELTLDVKPKSGDLTLGNHIDIAVSRTSSPTSGFSYYSIPTTDTGGATGPAHTDCPCIGDYPRIGTDANGFFVTTNEYPWTDDPGVFNNNFNGAQLYAMSKRALAAGAADVPFVHVENTRVKPAGGNVVAGFTLLPVQASGSGFAAGAGGTMYFLSSSAAEESRRPKDFTGRSSTIGLWTLTGTSTLDTARPAVHLAAALLPSQTYGIPPTSNQKTGPVPLRDCLQARCSGVGDPYLTQGENGLDSSDTRFLGAWYAGGRVLGALDTAATVSGNVQSAVAWFVVDPASAAVGRQGYLGVAGNNVLYPAIATDPAGSGVMGMTLVGDDHFPSAAYTGWTPAGPTQVYTANEGKAPEDGFCEYDFFNCAGTATPTARPRWGDYGAAAYDGTDLYVADEDIAASCTFATYSQDPTCGGTRSDRGNFSTQLTRLRVGGY